MLDDGDLLRDVVGAKVVGELVNAHVLAAAGIVNNVLRGADQSVTGAEGGLAGQADVGDVETAFEEIVMPSGSRPARSASSRK